MNLSAKERSLLEDQRNHEQLCIQKYANYASMASDPLLKGIFTRNGQIEQEHLNTINQLLSGQIPQMQSGGSQQQQQQTQQQQQSQMQMSQPQQQSQMQGNQQQSGSFIPQSGTQNYSNSDRDLCIDMLSTEKYVSGTYDTAIFEFKDPQVRNVLNHIQKEEQQHGEAIFTYMHNKGMYPVQ